MSKTTTIVLDEDTQAEFTNRQRQRVSALRRDLAKAEKRLELEESRLALIRSGGPLTFNCTF